LRRLYRFGQKDKVVCDVVTTEGQTRTVKNIQRKTEQAEKMFDMLVKYVQNEMNINHINQYVKEEEIPSWL